MITVLGGEGFVGSHLVRHLEREGIAHRAPGRDDDLRGMDLGDVIYCIGVTGDFRARPFDTVDAHVTRLTEVVRTCRFTSFLYLSSTRVYRGSSTREDDALHVRPDDPDALYDLTKLLGENIVLGQCERGRVARLSNVHGDGGANTFIASIVDAARGGALVLETALDSTRDYVHVEDVARLLTAIALGGRHDIYNVASGVDVSHAEVVRALGCPVEVAPGAPTVRAPSIDVSRLAAELGAPPVRILVEVAAR